LSVIALAVTVSSLAISSAISAALTWSTATFAVTWSTSVATRTLPTATATTISVARSTAAWRSWARAAVTGIVAQLQAQFLQLLARIFKSDVQLAREVIGESLVRVSDGEVKATHFTHAQFLLLLRLSAQRGNHLTSLTFGDDLGLVSDKAGQCDWFTRADRDHYYKIEHSIVVVGPYLLLHLPLLEFFNAPSHLVELFELALLTELIRLFLELSNVALDWIVSELP
jgi:hypothetical protein